MKIVIDTYGTHISYDNGVLVFKTDDTTDEVSLLHITSLHIQTHARISSEVIIKCIENNIPVYFEDQLQVKALIWSPTYGSISRIRKQQTLFAYSTYKYLIIKRLLIRKNNERMIFLRKHTSKKELLQQIDQLEQLNIKMKNTPDNDNFIRTTEAMLAKKYFEIYNQLIPKKYRFEKRTYQNSTDLLNMLLNYSYGILYKEVTKALIFAGLDPDLGFFHVPQYNKHTLSYDVVEPYRAWAEQSVYKTLKNKEFKKIENPTEQNKISKPLKRLLIEQMTEWMTQTKIKRNGRTKTPQNHIQLDMYALAQYILKFSEKQLLENICKFKN